MRLDFQENDLYSSSETSLDGSFRKPRSAASASSSSSKFVPTSRRVYRVLKDYMMKLVDLNLFTQCLEDWVLEILPADRSYGEKSSKSPFEIDELCSLDLALEGVLFQLLFRMPCSPYSSENQKEDEYLALEDFLHTIAEGLWRTFWHKNKPLPFFISFPRYPGSKFYTIEKAVSRGRLEELSGTALMSKASGSLHAHWDDVVEFALFKPDMMIGNEFGFPSNVACEALFYGVHILLARSLSKRNSVSSNCIFILVVGSESGAVVKIGGDLGNLEVDLNNPYESMAEWIKFHAEVCFSPVEQIWNKLGNANWRDVGTLQLILATFHSIAQWNGPPKKSIASLAAGHSLRLQKRRIECRLIENENALIPFQQSNHHSREIVELDNHNHQNLKKRGSLLKLEEGEILVVEDHHQQQKSFQIQESLVEGNCCSYIAIASDCSTELFMLYVGAHTSRLEPSWEDMSLWYQVQRQTKVLNILKEQGISSKFLPEIIMSGRMLHPGPCQKQSPKGCCDHPRCGTPVLVTYPVGETLSSILAHAGPFSAEEATRCCRDCLAALRNAKLANIQHGDICPENIIRIVDGQGAASNYSYILVSWGRAVLEDRDSPTINLQFSSAHALQNGKLCPSSDAESVVYLIYFVCGGTMPQQDSIESALQWRQRSWAKRLIQHHVGEVSALLKAFADYIDSICGTPYPVDYDTWLKRLSRAVDGSLDRGKMIDEVLRIKDIAESSGTSGGGNSSSC